MVSDGTNFSEFVPSKADGVRDYHNSGRNIRVGFGGSSLGLGNSDAEQNVKYLAERNGEICGMACVDYVHRPETAYGKARSFYHVQEIAVDENYRRQGVAKELLDFMIADTRKRKLKKIELDVWEFNDSAIEFYQATGFKETRRWMEYEVE